MFINNFKWEKASVHRTSISTCPFTDNLSEIKRNKISSEISICFRDIYVYVWKRMVEEKTPHRAILLANNDYKVMNRLVFSDNHSDSKGILIFSSPEPLGSQG